MVDFYSLVYDLQAQGVYDVVLPMILIFAIMFAILSKIKIFGDDNKAVNFVVSMVLALLIILPEYGLVDKLNVYLPRFAFIIIIVVTGLILLGLLGANVEQGLKGWVFLLFLVLSLLGLIVLNGEIFENTGLRYFFEDHGVEIGIVVGFVVLLALIVGAGQGGNKKRLTESFNLKSENSG